MPTISQYIESVREPYALFRTLGDVVSVRGADGEPVLYSGNNGVVFKIVVEGRVCQLKCYFRRPRFTYEIYDFISTIDSPYLLRARLLRDEMYVYDYDGCGSYHDVVVAPWVNGQTLEGAVRSAVVSGDMAKLEQIADRFDRMALYLLQQPCAHGDIKPDNIVVTPQGDFVLVDYDAMFVPTLAGEKGIEVGTPAYQHHMRDCNMYDRHIDDYSLALMSTALHAMAINPMLYYDFMTSSRDFCSDLIIGGESTVYKTIRAMFVESGRHSLVALTDALVWPTPHIASIERVFDGLVTNKCLCGVPKPFSRDSKWGYVDGGNEVVIEAVYDSADKFFDNRALVKLGGVFQYIDRCGNLAFKSLGWSDAKRFGGSRAAVCVGNKWGYIDTNGNMVVEPIFEFAATMHEGMAVVKYEGRYGYIDTSGNWAITPQFDYAMSFRDGTAMVEKDGCMTEIDKNGNQTR